MCLPFAMHCFLLPVSYQFYQQLQNGGNGLFSGHVRVYSFDGAFWVQDGQDIDGEIAYDSSGSSVAMSSDGNTVAIGARDVS